MAELDPNIQLLAHIRLSLSRGESLKSCLSQFCKHDQRKIGQHIASLMISHQQNKEMYDFVHTSSMERSLVLDLVWRGLKGESIYQHLKGLEQELETRAHAKLDQFIKTLPIKVLLVVMLFHFPALVILSLLPIVDKIMEAVK